jgi:glutathione synthase/RimK-type ligase-like ATP-grasp enzyme
MILYIGSSADKVYPRLREALEAAAEPFVFVDEDRPFGWQVLCRPGNGRPEFEIHGADCTGARPVNSIFVRHAVARSLDSRHLNKMGELQANVNRMLLFATCPTVNQPAHAYSNYSKPYQLGLMAEAGFEIPASLVTNDPAAARRFIKSCRTRTIFKGVSNVMTFAQVMTEEHLPRIDLLPHSPTLFQEYIEGADYRVHVIGDRTFATRLRAKNEDYRRSALMDDEEIQVEAAQLPPPLLKRCVDFTRQLGLVVSGIDFKEDADGRFVALEVNPYPQFTFYEGRSGQAITRAVVEYLVEHHTADTNVFA